MKQAQRGRNITLWVSVGVAIIGTALSSATGGVGFWLGLCAAFAFGISVDALTSNRRADDKSDDKEA